MSKAKWLLAFLLGLAVVVPSLKPIPSQAVELTLGGFPSYMRTRVHVFKNATWLSALTDDQARALGFNDADDNTVFADTRLRLTPQLVLSDSVTIRAQVDVADNNIWGGTNNILERDVIFSSLTPRNRFRGALIQGNNSDVRFNGLFGTATGIALGAQAVPVDDVQFFNVRMLHMDIVLPNNLGFLRVGRQPFDWGLGILANGGWDPNSDLGFVLDRFLYLKSWGVADGTFTFVFVTDRFRQGGGFTTMGGSNVSGLTTGNGDGYDIGAAAFVFNQGPLTVGYYIFPFIRQNNIVQTDINLENMFLQSGLIDYKTDYFRLVGEVQEAFGNITGLRGFLPDPNQDSASIDPSNLLFAGRLEVYPGFPFQILAAEFGYAAGDDVNPQKDGGNFQGNILAFNSAYNIDNLLFRHIVPTIYGLENSVINAFYVRGWATVKLLDNLSFTPQVLAAWNDQNQALVEPTFFAGDNGRVSTYLATELEGTLSMEVVPGVNFDVTGSVVIPGNGLDDLTRQRAALQVDPTGATSPDTFDAPNVPFAFQGRIMIFIDQFFKK